MRNEKNQPTEVFAIQLLIQPLKTFKGPYHFKFFKGCIAQILLGPFLNALSHIIIGIYKLRNSQGT